MPEKRHTTTDAVDILLPRVPPAYQAATRCTPVRAGVFAAHQQFRPEGGQLPAHSLHVHRDRSPSRRPRLRQSLLSVAAAGMLALAAGCGSSGDPESVADESGL